MSIFWVSVLMVVGMTGLSVQKHCLMQHSCSASREPHTHNPSPNGCSCENSCRIYGDCCRDSEHYDEVQQRRNANEYMCVEDTYMKGKCWHGWKDAEVEALCLKGRKVSDSRMSIPVTNTATNITYVNSYCAICNGENPNFLKMWSVALYCGSLNKDIQHNPVFEDGKWGIKSAYSSFEVCNTEHQVTEDVSYSTMTCKPTINTCDYSVAFSQHLESLCQSYSAPVYVDEALGKRFRNEFCASCNGYDGDKNCYGPVIYYTKLALSMLLDFSDWFDNEYVGYTGPCGIEQAWDRLVDKCRKVFCPKESETFMRGRCVPA